MQERQQMTATRAKPRLALVTPYRHHYGGVEYVNHMLVSMLKQEGLDTEFITQDLLPSGIITRLKKRLFGLNGLLGRYFNQHVAGRVEVAICNGEFAYGVDHPAAIASFHGCYYGYAHALRPHITKKAFEGLLKLAEQQRVGALGKYVISDSKFLADVLTQQGLSVDAVVDNAIDTELFRPRPEVPKADKLLFVGSSDYYGKGFDILEQLADRGVQIDCVTATKPRDSRLGWLGNIPNEELASYYVRYKATILPSRFEGCGLVVLESMACGTPIVMTSVGAGPSIARSIPEFVVSNDWSSVPDQICERISLIEKSYGPLGIAAREYVQSHHDYAGWRKQWLDILGHVLGSGSGGEGW